MSDKNGTRVSMCVRACVSVDKCFCAEDKREEDGNFVLSSRY